MLIAERLRAAATLNEQRDNVYRDNHTRLGRALAAMFPEGIMLETAYDHERFALISLMIVKLSRYAVQWSTGGHAESIDDLIVYAAMLRETDDDHRSGHGLSHHQRTDGGAPGPDCTDSMATILGNSEAADPPRAAGVVP
jgi:hypothetical protein